MRLLPRLMLLLGLIALILLLFAEVQLEQRKPEVDPSRVIMFFGGIVLVAILAGSVVATTFLPMLGEKLGSLIYGSSAVDEGDPIIAAHAAIEDGEYERAGSFYRQALAAHPDDTAVMAELVDLLCKHLGGHESAVALLDHALEKHWPVDERAFLHCKLAEVHGWWRADPIKAREALLAALEEAPGTFQARHAQALLEALDRPPEPEEAAE